VKAFLADHEEILVEEELEPDMDRAEGLEYIHKD
jgi:hypothetical protein